MRALSVLAIIGLVLWSVGGCASHHSTTDTSTATATKAGCAGCEAVMKAGDGWCTTCQKGRIDGKSTTCKGCVDAHAKGGTCATCVKK